MMRACTKYLRDKGKIDLTIAEIGVHNGMNAQEMMNLLNVKTLYLVDPYKAYVDNDSSCQQWYIYDSVYVDKLRLLAETVFMIHPQGGKAKFIRMPSLEAKDLFPDNTFDLVYIDANHSRPHVDSDIRAWYPKVKKEGMLGGHDWGIQDVQDAVHEFAKEMNITLQEDLFETDWFIIK